MEVRGGTPPHGPCSVVRGVLGLRAVLVILVSLILLTALALEPAWGFGREHAAYVRWALAILWSAVGLWSYRRLERDVQRRMERGARVAAKAGLLAGATAVSLVVLGLLGVSPSGIAVGGALTGVVLGLAAQSTLSNLLGGVVLMALRPYLPGDRVTLRSSMFSGNEYSGVVRDLNFFYTVLAAGADEVVVPNGAAVGAAIVRHSVDRRTVSVRLPAGCDVEAARSELAGIAPGSDLQVTRWAPDGIDVAVQVPAALPLDGFAAWARRWSAEP